MAAFVDAEPVIYHSLVQLTTVLDQGCSRLHSQREIETAVTSFGILLFVFKHLVDNLEVWNEVNCNGRNRNPHHE
jgi:hypothetical protein